MIDTYLTSDRWRSNAQNRRLDPHVRSGEGVVWIIYWNIDTHVDAEGTIRATC